jgi:uncharacterized protein (DUF1778 family)
MSADERRERVIAFKLTPTEGERMEHAASREGLSLASFARQSVLQRVRDVQRAGEAVA